MKQRIMAVILYVVVFLFLCRYFSQDWSFISDSTSKYNLLFVSGALLLVFGSYIVEPFFTKPVDVITNSTAIILALLSVDGPDDFLGYNFLLYSAYVLLLSSIATISFSYFEKFKTYQKVFFEIITKAGQSKIIFSFIYLLTIASYFQKSPIEFTFFLTFWIILTTQFTVESLIVWLSKIADYLIGTKKTSNVLGQVIWCENPFLYIVEVDFMKHKAKEVKKWQLVYLSMDDGDGAIGLVINEKQLLNKKWISVYLLEHEWNPVRINLNTTELITSKNTIFSRDNAMYAFDIDNVNSDWKTLIRSNYLYRNKDSFIWYITDGSDINKVRFHALTEGTNIKEWLVIRTKIYKDEVLFQLIDGKTTEEELEKHSIYGYLTWTAQKLGKYNATSSELETIKWLPNIYAPVFLNDSEEMDTLNPLAIWKLPETNLEILLKDPDSLVTHNTAILGILGIWKSCLTFELIQKIVNNTGTKIVCIDITNEYGREIKGYVSADLVQEEISANAIEEIRVGNRTGDRWNPTTWWNEELYKKKLSEELELFLSSTKRILIINPDWHPVSKAWGNFNIEHKLDLSLPEKTRIVSERTFLLSRKLWEALPEGERRLNKAKFLLVFEEAHALVPEWNSVSNEGDRSAVNGTAKVILQGRKFGLGSFVVTQRTANISKSILNQCNTIFAMRIFDDTGKEFLTNYIGSDYSNVLPTLQERQAIAVGKAIKLKQPVIIELNDREKILLPL